jgi:hypothetical protein
MNSATLRLVIFLKMLLLSCLLGTAALAADSPRRIPITLVQDDVIPTGNEWIALPTIRASDAALVNFNVLSMRDRGLLQVSGDGDSPALRPYIQIDGKTVPIHDLSWELIDYWVPTGNFTSGNVEFTFTYCAPPGSRAAFLHITATNHGKAKASVVFGTKASWGALDRVTYLPVALRGERTIVPAPWVDDGETFAFVTDDTKFAWAFVHPGSQTTWNGPPAEHAPISDAHKEVMLAPGASAEANFVLAAGVEEFSAAHNAKALVELLDRNGADALIDETAAWCRKRTRTTGQADLDLLMNRNFLFTALYAWGRTIDTEQLVGVTSRSPRYYVSAAYWDRDAMLWSFPGLLDIDNEMARDALEHALTIQLRNIGIHSRFIDGIVLEDGFQLDEAVAPIVALATYVKKTNDIEFLAVHRKDLVLLRDRVSSRFDSSTGLYSTLQDSQDEYQKLPFNTYSNVLTWRALQDMADLFQRLNDAAAARDLTERATALKKAILQVTVATPSGSTGAIFADATDGKNHLFVDVPPGSLMKLPALGFISENDLLFVRTYDWLHSKNYKYSYSDQPYGLPGSYRLPFTTSWEVADHLMLARGREQALKILRKSGWDGGIITEGVDPATGVMDQAGRAFATAAGYVAHAICEAYCKDREHTAR